ncbi:MAG TPA: hypothetical protein DCX07_09520, partial [Phycisphaerales bacterium]|nr:hypothetical protein [Phycisphaerales bacterium]
NKANLPEDVPTTKFLTYGGSTAGTIHLRTTAGDIGLKLSPPFALQSYAYADRWAGKRVPYFLLSNSEEITFDSKYREEVRVVITLDDSGNLDEAPKPIAFETPAFPIETPHRIHVNAVAPNAADSNPGTAEQPLKSINQAAQLATPGTRIVIHPGVYRESIVVKNSGTAAKPILFEGTKKGEVIVSGSDVWNGWQPGTDKDVYVHPWTFRWGLVAYPPGWEGAVTLQDIVRRREMIFLNGKPLRQVLNLKNLEPESFFVSEEEKKVYLRLPAGASMDGASVEVATRSALATVSAKQYVGFRNLVFQHDNTPLQGSALRIQNSSNILVEDCAFLWNNWSGLGIAGSRDLILRRIDASDNGGAGILAFQVFRCLMEDAETSRNTWRGAAGGFTGWAVAGVKLLRIHNWMVRRHRAVGNHSGGFWLDCDNENLMIEDCYWADNESRGCFIELSQGPITIRNTVIANNGGPGLITSNCRKITLEGNTFYGNRSNAQIAPRGVKEFSELTNYRTQEQYKLRNEEWVLKNNTVVSTVLQTPPLKVSGPGLELFFKTLTASRNLYFCPDPNQAFEISDVRMSLAKWQEASGQDLDSLFGEPRFRDVTKGRFDPAPGSPLLTRDSWEIRKLVGGAKDIMAGLAEEMLHESKTNWETPYALAKGHPDSGWHVLDLAAAANRGVSAKGQFSWIGVMPLEHFEAGEKRIHGVPFRILDEDMNNGAAAIALRSAKLDKQRDGTPYPDMVEIGLRKKAKAIYVLHASAYADTHEKIGRYEFVYKDGTTAGVDVVPFGKASIHLDVNNTLARESNIQDWYPSNPQFENENAKKVIVLDPKNPLKHVRYLYTLQWVNPHPDKEIAVIRLMSEPDKHVMLLVLGVTAMM